MRRKSGHDGRGRGGGVRQAGRGETGSGGETDRGGETGRGGETLPVFLFPSELLFHCEPRSCWRRILTLYNPYSFRLDYRVLCTAPSLYRVVEAEGSVRPKSCLDLVVRHLDVSPHNRGRRDWFRLEVRGGGQVGGREVWAELRGGEEGEGGGGGGGGEERKRRTRTGGQQRTLSALSPLLVSTHTQLPSGPGVRSASQWLLCVVVALLCVTVLMLPLHTDSSSVVPPCLHVSTNQKLACAYTLGLLTMVFLR